MHDLPLINLMAAAFAAAWVLGLVARAVGLSPIVGYLLAGIVVGPYTPGFVGEQVYASQLAELGVILLMFGVGLHFHPEHLLQVRKVAVPGAIGQSLVATALGAGLGLLCGWTLKTGLVTGMAMAVASTVVLIRVLTDAKKLESVEGHVAVGWLIVEDILTVVVLVLIPAIGTPADPSHAASHQPLWLALGIALLKLAALVAVLLVAGAKVVPWVMVQVARLRSRELFTLTVLVMAIAVAAGAAALFGASPALGAFLAGMVVGRTPTSGQAAADMLPLRDAFAVLFFAAVGMQFDPHFVVQHPWLLAGGLAIVVVGKPIAALLIVAVLGYPLRTGLTVALGLAQIGEFSFIVADLGGSYQLMNETGHNLLVACAIVSITVVPILFGQLGRIERFFKARPRLWAMFNSRAEIKASGMNDTAGKLLETGDTPVAVVLGYGPVGRTVDDLLRGRGLETVVVDMNMQTVEQLTERGRAAIYGDAFNIEVMHQALHRATHLVITLPHATNRDPLIAAAKLINPDIKVFVRARYLSEKGGLEQVGADVVAFEEAEVAVALSRYLLSDRGVRDESLQRETLRVRTQLQNAVPAADVF